MVNSIVELLFNKNIDVNKYKVAITSIAYLFLIYYVLLYARVIFNGGDAWKTGDWLINYEGGLIRRGLIGQVLYEISRLGISLLWIAFFLQSLIYFSIAYLILMLFFATKRESSWLLFIFSPAFIFLFPFLTVQGGFRKEIIVFLSFCLLARGLIHGRFNQRYLILSLIVYIFAVFSHESAVFCLIFFLYLLFESTKSDPALKGIGRAYIAGFLIAGAGGLVFSVSYPGGLYESNAICDSLKNIGLNQKICEGAIKYLRNDYNYALTSVAKVIPQYLLYYPIYLILAAVPLFLSDWWKKRLPLLILGFVSLIPMFIVALDWGRFIHIYIFMVFVSILLDTCNNSTHIRKIPLIAVIIYTGVWGMPYFAPTPSLGVLGKGLSAIHALYALTPWH